LRDLPSIKQEAEIKKAPWLRGLLGLPYPRRARRSSAPHGQCVQENPIKTIVRLVYAWRDLQQQGLHHCYNEREERYLIVTCIVITDVPEALGPLPVAVMAKASLPLYLAFAVYW